MEIPVTQAKGQLTELLRRAEQGEEIVLTRHGVAAVRLVPFKAQPTPDRRRQLLQNLRAAAAEKVNAGPEAARSQDFLYDDHGLPK